MLAVGGVRIPTSICQFTISKKQGIQLGLAIPKWLRTKHRQPCLTHGLKEGGLTAQDSSAFRQPSNNSSVLKSLLSLTVLCFSCIWHKMPSTVTEIYSCLQTLLLFPLTEYPWASLILSVTGQKYSHKYSCCWKVYQEGKGSAWDPKQPHPHFPVVFGCTISEVEKIIQSSAPWFLPTEVCPWWWFVLTHGHFSNGNAVK